MAFAYRGEEALAEDLLAHGADPTPVTGRAARR
jgi:hypothetical protein